MEVEVRKLHEIKGVSIPEPYARIVKILVSPEKETVPLGLSTPIKIEKAIESRCGTVGVSLIQPGKGMEPHRHKNEEETIYIINGRGEYIVAGKPVKFEPDTIIHIPANVEHGLLNSGDEMIKQVWFMTRV